MMGQVEIDNKKILEDLGKVESAVNRFRWMMVENDVPIVIVDMALKKSLDDAIAKMYEDTRKGGE